MVQGSRQDRFCIPSELRTEPEEVGCAGLRPILRIRVPPKGGTRVVPQRIYAFVSYQETKAFFLGSP